SINPDLVVINSGLNDVGRKISSEEFETKYKWTIEQIQQKTNAQILLRTSNKVMESDSVNKRLENDINPIVKKLSVENKTGFVDLYSYYSYHITNLGVAFNSINNDNFHPNEKGQQIIADLLLYTLLGDK
ncbi:SGNH/GDSL hydrolase family protein, partial [Stenotrophomonas panacihumi]|uniref:SGNH/GDSL hydrolase family protein n=2 Tax=Bacteria TaxID=2 RepID=UPI000D476F9D